MLPDAFAKAVRNLTLPGILKLLLICLIVYAIGMTVLSWAFGAVFVYLFSGFGPESWIVQMLGSMGGIVLAWFMFPLLYPVLVSFFDEEMAGIIEKNDYPSLPPASPPFWPTFWHDVRFTLKAVALNLLCLPLYFIPLVNMVVYYGLNGYLLGAQFFRMSAGRRVSKAEADAMLSKERGSVILAGAAISFCATIPLLNLITPVLGVATMLHLFHAMKGTQDTEILTR